MQLRRAEIADSKEISTMWLESRASSAPEIPLPVHSDEQVHLWFAEVVLPEHEVWVADSANELIAVLVLANEWIDQLYVKTGRTGTGIGAALVEIAKQCRPSGLKLWTFEANLRARVFYERHGFVAIGSTTGENEEGAPDVLYEWQ